MRGPKDGPSWRNRGAGRLTPAALRDLLLGLLLSLAPLAAADPWPSWRGPESDGHSAEPWFPTRWGPGENITWKKELPGARGSSSPVVWGPRIFLTAQAGQGPVEGDFTVEGPASSGIVPDPGRFNLRLFVLAIRTADGELDWAAEVAPGRFLVPLGRGYDYATPSCVTDGERVYAWFGTGPVTCFDVQGRGLWQRRLEEDFGPFDIRWGHGSSPILHDGKLILVCDHAPGSYVLALDAKTGETLWKLDLGRPGRSYSTPVAAKVGKRFEILVNWPSEIGGIDPGAGKLLWTVRGLDPMMVPMPVADGGWIYTSGGARSSPVMALRPGSDGIVEPDEVVWRQPTAGSYIASIVKVGGELYTAGETGVIKCLDAKSGSILWKQRTGAAYFASPVAAAGLVYAVDEDGEAVVLRAGRDFELVARNRLQERTVASPALSDGRIYLRTTRHLYCIGESR